MMAVSQDRTKGIDEIVSSIAMKAAPKNSEVGAHTASQGTLLNVNFHMADITRGGKGTSTKHTNIEALKKEAIRLISKVTNDVYNFCKNLELETITVGCKHQVTTSYPDVTDGGVEDIVLFKVRLNKKDIRELKHNPFLDTYSVTQYLKVVEDNFSGLRIVRQR